MITRVTYDEFTERYTAEQKVWFWWTTWFNDGRGIFRGCISSDIKDIKVFFAKIERNRNSKHTI